MATRWVLGGGLLVAGTVLAVRWPAPAPPPPPTAVVCPPAAATELRARMRHQHDQLAEMLTAAGQGDVEARVAAARAHPPIAAPAECILPAGWAELVTTNHSAWAVLSRTDASEDDVSAALVSATGACVACHDAHALVVR